MNNGIEEAVEEKKSDSPRRLTASKGLDSPVEIEFEDDPEDFGEDTELVPLTDELKMVFGDKKFQTEEELHDFMDKAGIADFPVILVDGVLYLKMPTDEHNGFTTTTTVTFMALHARFGCATGSHNVHLSSANGFRHREPDVSFFGAPRCVANRYGVLIPYNLGAVPDVVIQFSWRNKRGYEEDAIDEMMNDALEIDRGSKSLTCPRVGYLIKVRFKKKRTLQNALKGSKTQDMGGLDLYRLPYGTTVDDAINGTNGASKVTYVPGGPDHHIDITSQDLGLTRPSWEGFQIYMSDIFDEMDSYNKKRQQNLLAS